MSVGKVFKLQLNTLVMLSTIPIENYGDKLEIKLKDYASRIPERSMRKIERIIVPDTGILVRQALGELESIVQKTGKTGRRFRIPGSYFHQQEQEGDTRSNDAHAFGYILFHDNDSKVIVPDISINEFLNIWRQSYDQSSQKGSSRRFASYKEAREVFYNERIKSDALFPYAVIGDVAFENQDERFRAVLDFQRRKDEDPDFDQRNGENIKIFLAGNDMSSNIGPDISPKIGSKISSMNYFRSLIHWHLEDYTINTINDMEILAFTLACSYIFQKPAFLVSLDNGFIPVNYNSTIKSDGTRQVNEDHLIAKLKSSLIKHIKIAAPDVKKRLEGVQVSVVNPRHGDLEQITFDSQSSVVAVKNKLFLNVRKFRII